MNPLKDPLTLDFIKSLQPCYWNSWRNYERAYCDMRNRITEKLPATLLEILDWDFLTNSDKLWLLIKCGIRIGRLDGPPSEMVQHAKEYLASDEGFPEECLL